MECNLKSNSTKCVTQNRISLKMECHSKWNFTQNGRSLNWNITQNKILLKIECHLKWIVTQNETD